VVTWDGATLQGHIVHVDRDLAATSLAARQESWTEGEAADQGFVWQVNSASV
jgi:hypothetical protein